MADTTNSTVAAEATAPQPGQRQQPPASLSLINKEELQKVFDQFDANKDGKISLIELQDVLKSMGSITCTTTELRRAMEEIDTDKDGFISFSEFAELCRSTSSSSSAAAELRDAFDLYDQNKDGSISTAELHQVMNRIGMKVSVDECAKMIKSVDSDGDGCVSFDEFQIMMACNKNVGGESV